MKMTSSARASAISSSACRRPFGSGRSKDGARVPMAISFEAVGIARSPLYRQWSGPAVPVSKTEALLDRLRAFGRHRGAGIEFQVVAPAAMDTVILAARQSDHAVAARTLA